MTVVFILLGLLCLRYPVAVGLLVLAVAFDVLITGSGVHLGLTQALILISLLFSLPLAAILAGILFDTFVDATSERRIFAVLLPVLACSLMLGTGGWVDFAALALQLGKTTSLQSHLLLFSGVISSTIFCAGLTAFVVMALQLTIELPARWLQGALNARITVVVDALRPLTIVTVLALALNLIVGLCAHELWPATIAARLKGL